MIWKKYIVLILSAFIINTANFLYAKEKRTIAVFDFASSHIPVKYKQIIRNEIEFYLFNTGNFRVLEREKIDIILKEHYIKKHGSKKKLVISVGKTLSADFAVTGALDIIDTIDKKNKFKLRIKILNIRDGTILNTYSKKFGKLKKINKLTQKISKDISEDIAYFNQHGKIKEKHDISAKSLEKKRLPVNSKNDNLIFNIHTGLVYFYPIGTFTDIIKYGYGLSMDAGLTHVIFNNLDIGIETGYYRLKSNVGDFDRFILIPVLIKLEYKFPFYNRYFVFTNVSSGINIITNEMDEGKSARDVKSIQRTIVEPMIKSGIQFGILIHKDILIIAGTYMGVIMEKDVNMYFLNYSVASHTVIRQI